MEKSPKAPDTKQPGISDGDLEAFLDQASARSEENQTALVPDEQSEPEHRRLRVTVSEDRLEAWMEAVFADTTWEEIQTALKQERIVSGICEEDLKAALARADRSGRRQKDVPAARGTPAVYKKRKEVSYPFLEGLAHPETGEAVHLASSAFREIAEVFTRTHIDQIRGYGHPVVAVLPGETLLYVEGEDEIEPGCDVFGKSIKKVAEEGPICLKAGEGVDEAQGGTLTASRFGYVSITHRFLSVLSPIWVSSDRMAAYFVNPPQMGTRKAPAPEEVIRGLKDLGICIGIEEKIIEEMCRDLFRGGVRESCVRIAHGERPHLSEGQIAFTFEPIPPARFEGVRDALKALDLETVQACEMAVPCVHGGVLLAEQAEKETVEPCRDLFGDPVPPPDDAKKKKVFKAGPNVRRETREGKVQYISEIYGYAGLIDNRITVLSPLWMSKDRMAVHFVALPLSDKPAAPSPAEIQTLLARAQVGHGVDKETIERICQKPATERNAKTWTAVLAKGTPSEPGQDGVVELLFKRLPDPGKMLDDNSMDFRDRDAVPNIETGHLLAVRTFPEEGAPGQDVRGRSIKPPKPRREILYQGPNVVSKEEDGEQRFYATQAGFARVVKDTLSVLKRFRHPGDVDYEVGNIKFDGDVEIGGTVKNGFKIEATGDVYIDGAVEHRAYIIAEGDVVVRGGIIGAKVRAGGTLYAKFIQDADIISGEDLMVRHYIQNSQVRVRKNATIQGDEGGSHQLCLLGGVLQAGEVIEAASIGSRYGRPTHIIAGIDTEREARLRRYQQGLSFCDMRTRKVMRPLLTVTGGKHSKEALEKVIQESSKGRRAFLLKILQEMQHLGQVKTSLEHYLTDLTHAREEAHKRARIRVTGTAFPKVTVQVGEYRRVLAEEVKSVAFHFSRNGDQVVQELL